MASTVQFSDSDRAIVAEFWMVTSIICIHFLALLKKYFNKKKRDNIDVHYQWDIKV